MPGVQNAVLEFSQSKKKESEVMDLDTFGTINLVRHASGQYIKFQIFPSKDLKTKMSVGTMALDMEESRRLFNALKAIFEDTMLPSYVRVIDMRGMQRVSQDLRVKQE